MARHFALVAPVGGVRKTKLRIWSGEPFVVALLLLAGLMHASWNAAEVRHVGTFGVFMATGT